MNSFRLGPAPIMEDILLSVAKSLIAAGEHIVMLFSDVNTPFKHDDTKCYVFCYFSFGVIFVFVLFFHHK